MNLNLNLTKRHFEKGATVRFNHTLKVVSFVDRVGTAHRGGLPYAWAVENYASLFSLDNAKFEHQGFVPEILHPYVSIPVDRHPEEKTPQPPDGEKYLDHVVGREERGEDEAPHQDKPWSSSGAPDDSPRADTWITLKVAAVRCKVSPYTMNKQIDKLNLTSKKDGDHRTAPIVVLVDSAFEKYRKGSIAIRGRTEKRNKKIDKKVRKLSQPGKHLSGRVVSERFPNSPDKVERIDNERNPNGDATAEDTGDLVRRLGKSFERLGEATTALARGGVTEFTEALLEHQRLLDKLGRTPMGFIQRAAEIIGGLK